MKLRLFVPAFVATVTTLGTAGIAHSEALDAQAQAAALLSGAEVAGPARASESQYAIPSSVSKESKDAHASAAALLSGSTSRTHANASTRVASAVVPTRLDAQAHAAALLRGSRPVTEERSQSSRGSEALDEHPAVLVARTWSTRGIDPNTFIVGHAASLRLVAASPTERQPESAQNVLAAGVTTLAR